MKKLLYVTGVMILLILIIGLQGTNGAPGSFSDEDDSRKIGTLHNVPLADIPTQDLEASPIAEPAIPLKSELPTGFIQVSESLPNPEISAEVALVSDMETSQILFEQNSHTKKQLASITKLMTALVIAEEYTWDSRVYLPMSATAFQTYGGNSLLIGEEFLVEDLMKALLMASSNDAATLLAEYFGGGSYDEFIAKMNQKAQELGMTQTQFANPHGLDEKEDIHYSTASDIVLLTQELYFEYPEIWDLLMVPETQIYAKNGREVRVGNTNQLLDDLPGMLGAKTGLTEKALETFATVVEIQGREVCIVVLGSDLGGYRFRDTEKLRDWIDTHYKAEL